jgi:Flp pilus assembly protein TadG
MKPRNAKMIGGAPKALLRILTARGNFGSAAVEFAIFVPVFMVIVAGTADFGYWIYAASELTAAVSAGSQYAEINGPMVAKNPSLLATNISNVINNANGTGWATSTVSVNNGSSTSCYCPTGTPGSWNWGSAVACGSACADGGVAGQFVTITASYTVSPLFSTYNLTYNGAISRSAIVETQ